jgi:hypothetical protein
MYGHNCFPFFSMPHGPGWGFMILIWILAFEVVAALRKRGFKARRLEEGYPKLRSAGMPVEKSMS